MQTAHSVSFTATARFAALAFIAVLACLMVACGGGSAGGGPVPGPPPPPAPGFSVEVGPASAVAFADSGRVLTVTLVRMGGFTADVTVTLSNPPAGVTAEAVTFTGGTASLSLPLTLDDSVAPGNLALAFNASSGGISASTTLQLSVQATQARTQRKIEDALAANSIDRDTSLLYRLYALAGDPRLPDEFVGSGGDEEDLALFNEVDKALPQMSAAMQAAVHPFMVRPDHPDSIYRRPGTTSTRSNASDLTRKHALAAGAAAPASSECTAGAQWRSARSTKFPVRVWSECYDDPVNTSLATIQASLTMAIFEKIWTPMTNLMGPPLLDGTHFVDKNGNDVTDNGGDDAIDVYIVNSYSMTRSNQPINTAAVGTAYGFARAATPCIANSAGKEKCSGYLVLPAAFAGSNLQRSTIIHEFFHVLQYAHHADLHGGWLYEATARWSESHYDRVLDWPQRMALEKVHMPWFKRYLTADVALDWTKDKHPYASYIWPFFLEQETGGPAIIGQVWTALEAAGGPADEDRIIDAAYGFDANFHRFAVRNVNEELLPGNPLGKRYIDLAGIRDGVNQFPDNVLKPVYVNRPLVKDSEDTSTWAIKPLSAKYARFTVDRAAPPSQVEFDFTGLADRTGLKLDALILSTASSGADEWVSEPVPLEFAGKAVFCFQAGPSTATVRGAFTTLRLVLSNSSLEKTVTGNIVVRPTGNPCATSWQGTIEESETYDDTEVKYTTTITTQLTFDLDNNAVDPRSVFRLRSGSFNYRQSYADGCVISFGGPLHPALDLNDTSDGATSGTLYTYVGPFGTPLYDMRDDYGSPAMSTKHTLTTAENCGVPPEADLVLPLWQTDGPAYDITQGGTVMKGSYTAPPTPVGSRSYTWLLTKQSQ